jgi:hypothetical protein
VTGGRVPVSDEVLLQSVKDALASGGMRSWRDVIVLDGIRDLLASERVTMWRSDVASISADVLRGLLDGES